MPESCDRYVTLRGGLTVPVEPLQLLWRLEDEGFRISVDNEDRIVVRPGSRLTPADEDAIRRWRRHLCALIEYDADAAI